MIRAHEDVAPACAQSGEAGRESVTFSLRLCLANLAKAHGNEIASPNNDLARACVGRACSCNHDVSGSVRLSTRLGQMTTRTTDHHVTFRKPFALPGWEETWPAGDYTVTTHEELLDTSFPAYHRVSTTIALRRAAETRHVEVTPIDLAAALDWDGQ